MSWDEGPKIGVVKSVIYSFTLSPLIKVSFELQYALWHLTIGVPTMPCDVQNAKLQLSMTAFIAFLMHHSFKFKASAHDIRHLMLVPKG